MEIYGPVKLKGTLEDGTGDPLITKDASSSALGTAENALGTLNSARIFVGNASNVPTGVDVTGDVTISNAGVTSITAGCIVNADINAAAAIAFSKMVALTASRALVSDGSGVVSVATTTATELGYVNGVTSAIQTQINAKQATITGAATTVVASNLTANRAVTANASGKLDVSAVTTTELGYVAGVTSAIQTQLNTKLAPTITGVAEGDIIYYNGTAWVNLPRGTDGQTLRSSSTSILWDTPTINGIPIGGTNGQVLAKQSGTDFDADWETLTVSSITDLTATAAELNVLDGITATVTELNYTDGVSGNIQTQLDGKLSSTLPQNALFVGNSSNVATALSSGTNGYVLTSVSGVPTWQPVSAGSVPGTDTQVLFNDGGSFGADAGMVYDKTNNVLKIGHSYYSSGAPGSNNSLYIGSSAITTATGTDNVCIGDIAGFDITTGNKNTLIGDNAGTNITEGIYNCVLGAEALGAVTTGSYNIAIGAQAGFLVTGDDNITIGRSAGDNISTGDGNVIIGTDIDAPSATSNGQLSIQNIIYGISNTATGTTVSTGNIGIGKVVPAAKLDIVEDTLGSAVLQYASTTSNADPTVTIYQNKVATTDATPTTIHTVVITASQATLIRGFIVARRSGGVSGTAEDCAAYDFKALYKNVAGTATLVGSATITAIGESQAAWDVTLSPSSNNVNIQVTGAANNNITWMLSELRIMQAAT